MIYFFSFCVLLFAWIIFRSDNKLFVYIEQVINSLGATTLSLNAMIEELQKIDIRLTNLSEVAEEACKKNLEMQQLLDSYESELKALRNQQN